MISPEQLKQVLGELAETAWEKTPDGHYVMRQDKDAAIEKPSQHFGDVFGSGQVNKQEDLAPKMIGMNNFEYVDLPAAEKNAKNEKVFELIDGKLKGLGIDNVNLCSDGGRYSYVMNAGSEEYTWDVKARLALIERSELPRPPIDNVLQAYKTICFDAEGNPAKEDQKNAMKIEIVPGVPVIMSQSGEDMIDRLPGRSTEEKNEIRDALYKSYLANIPEGYICNDPGQRYDLAIMPDATLVNVDGGAISDMSALKQKKIDQLKEMNSAYTEGMEVYKGIGEPNFQTQKMLVPESMHDKLGLRTQTSDLTDAKSEVTAFNGNITSSPEIKPTASDYRNG